MAVTGAGAGFFSSSLILLKLGNPNQPPVECSSFLGAGGAFAAVTGGFAGSGFGGASAGFGGAAAFTGSAVDVSAAVSLFVEFSFAASFFAVSSFTVPPLAVSPVFEEGAGASAVALSCGESGVAVVASPGALLAVGSGVVVDVAGCGFDVLGLAFGAVAEVDGEFPVAEEFDGLTFVNSQVAMPMPAKMNTVTATPAISIPEPPFLAGAEPIAESAFSSTSLSTNVGRRPRFLPPFGGVERSLFTVMPDGSAPEPIFASACMLGGMPAGIVAEMPGSLIGETSAKILPKSTGEDEAAFVQGTAPGASTSGDGLPGKIGDMRELEIIDALGGGDCGGSGDSEDGGDCGNCGGCCESGAPTGVIPGGA